MGPYDYQHGTKGYQQGYVISSPMSSLPPLAPTRFTILCTARDHHGLFSQTHLPCKKNKNEEFDANSLQVTCAIMDATKEIEMSYWVRLSNIYFSVSLTFVTSKLEQKHVQHKARRWGLGFKVVTLKTQGFSGLVACHTNSLVTCFDFQHFQVAITYQLASIQHR